MKLLAIVLMALARPCASATAQDSAPVTISLDDAIRRAEQNEPAFAAASAGERIGSLDRTNARAALLPSVIYHNQVLYTQPNGAQNQSGQTGSQSAPRFIANNAVREYASQASIDEKLGLKQIADLRAASASAARASAELEVARRGLVAAVVHLYYSVGNSAQKVTLLESALKDAAAFTDLTTKREAAREAAHADVVKASLQQQQRQRELEDARLEADKARLELAILLFPDPRTDYKTESSDTVKPLPPLADVQSAAAANNPELKSALASFAESNAEVLGSRAAYLPDLQLNFTYGIDAPQFARRGPEGVENLGYSMSATLDIPVWDWLSTQRRVRQSEIRRDAVRTALTATQRRLVANLDEAYREAETARAQIDLLSESEQTAKESLRLTEMRYTAGEGTVFEVVDAQSALLAAETAKADGYLRYQTALGNLQTLTGTL
ncbi:MAG: TolC family protein [Acidobacteriaceae bacterium]|nr:TolC family protein [Acidobacteriaceae bacterium]